MGLGWRIDCETRGEKGASVAVYLLVDSDILNGSVYSLSDNSKMCLVSCFAVSGSIVFCFSSYLKSPYMK